MEKDTGFSYMLTNEEMKNIFNYQKKQNMITFIILTFYQALKNVFLLKECLGP